MITVDSEEPKKSVSVTVVIPCYNCEDTIERAVESVISQTVSVYELVLVDDASNDSTLACLYAIKAKYDLPIKVIENPVNSGVSCSRNRGIISSNQKYVAFLDADDSWNSEKIRTQYEFMEQHNDVVICAHDVDVISSCEHSQVSEGELFSVEPQRISLGQMLLSNRFSTPTVMMRNIGMLFNESMRYCEDYELWIRVLLKGGRIVKLNQVLAYLYKGRYGESGLSSHMFRMELAELTMYLGLFNQARVRFWVPLLCVYSLAKFVKRSFISLWAKTLN